MPKYLLPCSCGQSVPVGVHQAGLTVACACGKQLDVPTRRAITQLQPMVEAAPPSATAGGWGLRQRMMFLGALLLVPALAGLAAIQLTWPADEIGPLIAQAGPADAREWWQALRAGIDTRTNPASLQFVARLNAYRLWTFVCYGGLAVGGLLIGAAFLTPNGPGPRRVTT